MEFKVSEEKERTTHHYYGINWIFLFNVAHVQINYVQAVASSFLGVGCLHQRASFARTARSWITRRALLTMYPLARSKYIPCVLPTWSPILPLRNVQTKPTKSCTSVGPVQGTLPRICKRSMVGCFAPFGRGRVEATHQRPLGAVTCCPLLLLTCAVLMTPSHIEGQHVSSCARNALLYTDPPVLFCSAPLLLCCCSCCSALLLVCCCSCNERRISMRLTCL